MAADSDFDYGAAARHLDQRFAERKRRLKARTNRARDRLASLVQQIRDVDPDIRRIVLFGSLSEETGFSSMTSDIDVAVDSDRYLEIVARVSDPEMPVDVIDLRTARKAIRHEIDSRGEVLYERS
jgi:predicted nucleotidyltransferase